MPEKYRENVAIIVCNSQGKVLLCARADKSEYAWQFPQGGIDDGESVVEAAVRELREETGLSDVTLIKEMPNAIKYRFPQSIRNNFRKNGWNNVGQNQHYVLFLINNDNITIDFETHPEEIEFKAWRWADIDDAPKEIIYFKKEAYQQAVAFFKPYIQELINK